MKKIIILIVVLLVIFTSIPWVNGMYFKHYYTKLLLQINELNQDVSLQITEYHLGWLHSTATLSVTSQHTPKTPAFIIKQTISHGPYTYDRIKKSYGFAMASIINQVFAPPSLQNILLPNKPNQHILLAYSLVKFDGDVYNHMMMPIFNISPMMFGEIVWLGLKGDIYLKVDRDLIKKINTDIQIGTLNVSNPNKTKQLIVEPISIHVELMRNPLNLWIGNSSWITKGIFVKDNANVFLSLEELKISAKSNINANSRYSFIEQLDLNKITSVSFPPVPMFGPINFMLSAQEFNAQTFSDLKNVIRAKNRETLRSQLDPILLRLVTPESTINNTVSIITPLGPVKWSLKLFLISQKTSPTTLNDMLVAINAVLNLRIAIPLVDKIIEFYAPMLANTPLFHIPEANNTNSQTQPANQQDYKKAFNQNIAQLIEHKQIPLSVAIEVMSLRDKKLPENDFTQQLQPFGLSADLTQQVSTWYAEELKLEAQAKLTASAPKISPSDKIKMVINQWITQGYLIQENNDYLLSVTREGGVVKINGKIPSSTPVSLPAPNVNNKPKL